MSLLLAMVASAAAQVSPLPGDADFVAPEVASDLFRPSLDATRFMTLSDTMAVSGFTARARVNWVKDPLVWFSDDGSEVSLVQDAVSIMAGGSIGIAGRLQLGAWIPAYLFTRSELDGNTGAALGDPSIDARVLIREGGDVLGVAALGRVTLPLGGAAHQLGFPGVSGELGVAVDRPVGPVLLGTNLGIRFTPQMDLDDLELNDQLWFRAGAAWQPGDRDRGLSLEYLGNVGLASLGQGAAGAPMEIQAGAWTRNDKGTSYRVAIGSGVLGGVGAPRVRLVLGVGQQGSVVSESAVD